MKFGHRFYLAMYIFLSATALATIILAINEVTVDVLDRIGSNYWLGYGAIISGITLLLLIWRGRQQDRG